MEDIFSLLNIDQGLLNNFQLQAKHLVDHQTELSINRQMRTLADIAQRLSVENCVTASQQTVDEIMLRVKEQARKQDTGTADWSIHDLRIISYYLVQLRNDMQAYQYALHLLDTNWRDLFLNGLAFHCLENWNRMYSPYRIPACELLTKKLCQYEDNNPRYIAMKSHADFFAEAGPQRLATLLTLKETDLREAPTVFGHKPTTLSRSYYSDVILHYFRIKKIMDLNAIETILQLHHEDRTRKLLFADMVFRFNQYGDDLTRNQLCKFANRILGDITLTSTWAPFEGATQDDVDKLRKAKQLVNFWFNQKIIETFFEVCVQDNRRKGFWLKFVDRMYGFMIVGSEATKKILQADVRINTLFNNHFIQTNSTTVQTSALALFFGNKMIVEFSDIGSVYAYNLENAVTKQVITKSRFIRNLSSLKRPSIGVLINNDGWSGKTYYEEGRMSHSGYWEGRLQEWLEQVVFSAENRDLTFFNDEDKKIFQPKPLDLDKTVSQYSSNPPLKETTKDSPISSESPSSQLDKIIVDLNSAIDKTDEKTKNEFKDIHAPDFTPKQTLKSRLVYRTHVYYKLYTKSFAEGRCRIVCNPQEGYFLQLIKEQKYIHLFPLSLFIPGTSDSMWIKRLQFEGWFKVIHKQSKTKLNICSFYEENNTLIFKENLHNKRSITIHLDS